MASAGNAARQPVIWPQAPSPQPQVLHAYDVAVIMGIVAAFFIPALLLAFYRRLTGLQSISTYPPLVMLRQEAWRYPAHGDD